jgi:DNA polymerase-3 subunit alpha
MSWIPLHVHSQYSILDSAASVDELAERAKELGMPACALTDQGNLYGAIEFYKACQNVGVGPILGCELVLAPGSRLEKKRVPGSPVGFPLILLAKNAEGYQNLCKLSSIAHIEGFYYTPRIDKEVLEKHHKGLICLSGPLSGKIAYLIIQGREEEAIAEAKWFQTLFQDDYYFEVQRHRMKEEDIGIDKMEEEGWLLQNYRDYVRNQEVVLQRLVEMGKVLGIRSVATQGSHYLHRSDWKAHEILMNVQSGEPCEIWERDSAGNPKRRVLNPKRQVYFSHELYFKSAAEMGEMFADLPDALKESVAIAEKIELKLDFKTKYYPVFTPPAGITKEEYLKKLCEEGIERRYPPAAFAAVEKKYPGRNPLDVVRERLAYELNLIISKEMCDYLLIVHDFIAWAKNRGIPMGPGRGSGAGSIILYLTGITDIEPLRFNLFFERFINPERISYPDIDVDICMDRRQEVIDYTVSKYGKDRVAQIITFGTMKAKMAIKDVGRVLNVPLPKVNAIAKLVPEELNITLDKALQVDADFRRAYETDAEVREVIDIARRLEGSVRNTGIHAAGIIISGDPLTDRIPVCAAKDSEILATQYSMKPVELVGMLKIDLLGLKTLTSVQKTVDAIHEAQGVRIDWVNLPLDDSATFSLLNSGRVMGIFQIESAGMQDLAKQLHIDRFEEIVAVVALYRPGPMEMIPSYVSRKHGKEMIEIDHPLMKDVLEETYGIMVYQEQVMQIASLLANYSLGEGDVLRRAMGKKDREEMAKQREKFQKGALQKGIDQETAMRIFDKIEKFASYGFNKSHAAAYGYLVYVTAYLKANYPREWMAALMTCDRDDITKVAKIIAECQEMKIPIFPPDVNESGQEFVATPKGIRFAMGAIKGVGEAVVDAIVAERKNRGPFVSLLDFFKRVDTKKVGKKTVDLLIEAGCFDFMGWSRSQALQAVEPMFQAAVKEQKESAKGVIDFFSVMEGAQESQFQSPPEVAAPLSKQQMLRREKELLGFYLTGHPLDEFQHLLKKLSCIPLSELEKLSQDAVFRTAFIVEEMAVKISAKTQKKFAILTISDGVERYELPIWPEMYEEKSALITEGKLLYAVVQLDLKEGECKLQCRWMSDLSQADEAMIRACDAALDQARAQVKAIASRPPPKPKEAKKENMKRLHLKMEIERLKHTHILAMKSAFRSHSGSTPVQVEFWASQKRVGTLEIDSTWGVSLQKELEEKLRGIPSLQSVTLVELDPKT